jgi:hypothetical protein
VALKAMNKYDARWANLVSDALVRSLSRICSLNDGRAVFWLICDGKPGVKNPVMHLPLIFGYRTTETEW